jgi:hypothetical protein
MTTKIRKVIAVLNTLDLALAVLKKSFSFAEKYDAIVEVVYIHETPLFDVPDFFISEDKRGSDLLDKDMVKSEIKSLINSLGYQEDIAIFVYIDDTEDRVDNLIKDDDSVIVITSYHEKITKRVIKKVSTPILVLKNPKESYKNISICINSSSRAKKCISLAKELFSNSSIHLMYDYRFVVDPTMELDLQNIALIEEAQREIFQALKDESKLDGEFFVDSSFSADNLIKYINEKDFDLVIDCLNDNDLLVDQISNNIFFKGDIINEHNIELNKIYSTISNSEVLSEQEKRDTVKKVQEWYEEDLAMELLEEQLISISSKITPILKQIGLL